MSIIAINHKRQAHLLKIKKIKCQSEETRCKHLVALRVTTTGAVSTTVVVTGAEATFAGRETTLIAAGTEATLAGRETTLTLLSDGNADVTSVNLGTVHGRDGTVGIRVGFKGHKAKATAAAGFAIAHNDGIGDVSELGETTAETVSVGVPREVTNVKFGHYGFRKS